MLHFLCWLEIVQHLDLELNIVGQHIAFCQWSSPQKGFCSEQRCSKEVLQGQLFILCKTDLKVNWIGIQLRVGLYFSPCVRMTEYTLVGTKMHTEPQQSPALPSPAFSSSGATCPSFSETAVLLVMKYDYWIGLPYIYKLCLAMASKRNAMLVLCCI